MLAGSFEFWPHHLPLASVAVKQAIRKNQKALISNLFRLRNELKSDRLTVVSLSDFSYLRLP
jgi:hypothetical protein